MRIAIIGSGISGSLAARLLSTQHDIILFEASDRPGGHAHTVDVRVDGAGYAVDAAFMVFNRQTYPNFCRLLQLLEVGSRPTEMSFSVSSERSGLQYQSSSLNGLFAQRLNALRPSFLQMLGDIVRFNQCASKAAESGCLTNGQSVGDFLRDCRVGNRFVSEYLVPMAAAIWSSQPQAILNFPAQFMIGFFANHGLLQISGRPQWRTIVGGSQTYVDALLEPIRDQVRLRSPIASVQRTAQGVRVTPTEGPSLDFDHVVLATHADQTLEMLADPTPGERKVLSAFPYQVNRAVLHTDTRMLPPRRRAWASWNYRIATSQGQGATVTYDLSRLQQLATGRPILLTLNDIDQVSPDDILREFVFRHPAFSRESIAAQSRWETISGRDRTHYCGAYWGYGFHEDGVNSALNVARSFELGLDACIAASTREPSCIGALAR